MKPPCWRQERNNFTCRDVLFTLDHAFPAPTVQDRKSQKALREFCQKYPIRLYQNGEGVLHQVVAEEKSIWPGMIIVGADGHVATVGAFGAVAFSVDAENLIPVLENGQYTVQVPEQITVAVEGILPPYVLPRDVAFALVREFAEEIKGKAVALTGSLFERISLAGKMTICNFLPEAGVKTAFILPEGEKDQVDRRLQVKALEPLIAVPPAPNLIKTVKELEGTKISVAIAGGCSAGRIEDMKVLSDVLQGQMVHPGVTLIVTPASKKVLAEMESLGLTQVLREAGAVLMPPGCGPCPGKHFGLLADDDVAITTTIRNTPGRIGSKEAKIYLASPFTVVLAALNGEITVVNNSKS
ncbi:MAG: 3-isopropylmalate dehydratase [Peptococcaceae bacterium]|nr:3-isopropylmalate dehydratase [Peptococcaceae bacterium]